MQQTKTLTISNNDEVKDTRERVIDYISNLKINKTPEEVEAVEDYNYPKENIQTHPQFRVKVRPSDERKEYPIDIPILDKKIINNITEIVKKSFELKNESNKLDKEMLKLLNDSL